MEKVLLIESDQGLTKMVAQALGEAGFKVVTASHTAAGLKALYETLPDMVIMDEKLPRLSGEQLCPRLRRISDIPIVVLVDAEEATARFVDMGADACLTKPLGLRLLLARVRSLFRRCRTNSSYNFPPGIDLDCEAHQVNLGDNTIELTPTEFRLCSCLVLNGHRLVPYPELAMGVWGREKISPSNLKFCLSCLKKKLGNGSDSDFDLLNQRGVGFRFVMQ